MGLNEATLAEETQSDRKGDYINLYSGGRYYPLDPRPEEVNIEDISHSLSMLCRYDGHVDRFYSVAEHCILLSHAVPTKYKFEALLHDAAEAYLSDIPRPLKYAPELKQFREIEDLNTKVINTKFGLPPETSQLVKEYDARIVTDERRALFKHAKHTWGITLDPINVFVMGYTPQQAEEIYWRRFRELYEN